MNSLSLKNIALNITDGEHGTIKDDIGGEYFYLSNKNIIDNNVIYDKNDRKISKDTFEKINKRIKLEKDDLLLSTVGTIGKTVIVKEQPNYTFQRSVGIIKINKKLANPYYIKYYLDTPTIQKKLNQIANGGVQKGLYISDLENLKIDIPSIQIQEKIANTLKILDDKIDINNKIINESEKLAKKIYDYWFIQFEFPNKDNNPYKSSSGKMIYNEKLRKDLPIGWEYKKISEIEENIITGKTPSTKKIENFNGNIPFITIDDIRQNLYVNKTIRTLSNKGADFQKNKYIPKDSICVTCIATVGLIGITTKESQTNQQINSIVCNNKNNLFYLVNALSDYFNYSNSAKSGNIFDNMNKDDFSSIKIIYPTSDILAKYNEKVMPIYEKIKYNVLENEKLTNLKNYLLPLLMNGQVSFKDKKILD